MANTYLENIVSNLYSEIGYIFGDIESFKLVLNKNNLNELLYNANEYVEDLICLSINTSLTNFFINYLNKNNSMSHAFEFFNDFINKHNLSIADNAISSLVSNKAVANYLRFLDQEDDSLKTNNLLNNAYTAYYISDTNEDNNTYYHSNDSEKDYLNTIKKIPVFTIDEEKEIFTKLTDLLKDEEKNKKEIKEVKDKIICHNLRLVANIAKKEMGRYRLYDCPSLSLLDLIQEGNIALTEKLDRFDVSRGFKFSTFIVKWIRQAIDRYIEEFSKTIRIPSYQYAFQIKVNRAIEEHFKKYGVEPTDKVLVSEYGIDQDMLQNYRKAAYVSSSLDKPINDDEPETTFGDFTVDENIESPIEYTEKNDLKYRLDKMTRMSFLVDPRQTKKSWEIHERDILIYKTMNGLIDGKTYTLEETASKFGITRQRVCIICEKIQRRIRILDPTCERDRNIPNIYDELNLKIEKFKDYCKNSRNHISLVSYELPSGKATLECNTCGNKWIEKINKLGKNTMCMKCALLARESKKKEELREEEQITTEKQAIFALSRYTHISYHELELALMEMNDEDKFFLLSKINQPKSNDELRRYNDLVDKLRDLSLNINAKIRLRKRRQSGSDSNE